MTDGAKLMAAGCLSAASDSPAQRVEFDPKFAAFGDKGVALSLQHGARLLDPPEPFLLLIELTSDGIELLLQPLSDFILPGELCLKLPDGVPREREIVTVVERDGEHWRLLGALLTRPIGAHPIGVRAPLSGSAALARNSHWQHCNETRRNLSTLGNNLCIEIGVWGREVGNGVGNVGREGCV